MFASSVGVASLLLVSVIGAETGLPLGLPPQKADPVIARIAPEECLLYYSWEASAAPDPKSKNQTELLLAEPEVQRLLVEFHKIVDQVAGIYKDTDGEEFSALIAWGKIFLHRPTALYVSKFNIDRDSSNIRGGAVINVGEDAEKLKKTLENLIAKTPKEAVTKDKLNGKTLYRVRIDPTTPEFIFYLKDGYLYFGVGEGEIKAILERTTVDPPKWLLDLHKDLPLKRRSSTAYVNTKSLIDLFAKFPGGDRGTAILDAVGFKNIAALKRSSGLDDSGYVTRSLVALNGMAEGLLSVLEEKPLSVDDLKPIPADATLAMAARLDADKLLEAILSSLEKIDPNIREEMEEAITDMADEFGIHLRNDLVKSLGDAWCLYHSPGEGGYLAGFAAAVQVRDRDRLVAVQEKIVALVKRVGESDEDDGDFGFIATPQIAHQNFKGQRIYYFRRVSFGFPFAPAWCITDDELIVGMFPQTVRTILSRDDDFQSLATKPEVARLFQSGNTPLALTYQNTPELFELAYPWLQIGAKLLLSEIHRLDESETIDLDISFLPSGSTLRRHLKPGVTTVRRRKEGFEVISRQSLPGVGGMLLASAIASVAADSGYGPDDLVDDLTSAISPNKAREKQSINNLRHIALAMHNYHDAYKNFPTAYNFDKDGKPLLSWRVHILPFIEQGTLYDRFHLDEPWDSEHNKKLIPLMPKTYQAPGSKAGEDKTNYLTLRGMRTVFPGRDKIRFANIVDGTSNTIMAVEANDKSAVIWTKPDDLTFDPMNPNRGIPGLRKDGFLAAMCDGSVHKLDSTLDKEMLFRLMTRDDGKVVDGKVFPRR